MTYLSRVAYVLCPCGWTGKRRRSPWNDPTAQQCPKCYGKVTECTRGTYKLGSAERMHA